MCCWTWMTLIAFGSMPRCPEMTRPTSPSAVQTCWRYPSLSPRSGHSIQGAVISCAGQLALHPHALALGMPSQGNNCIQACPLISSLAVCLPPERRAYDNCLCAQALGRNLRLPRSPKVAKEGSGDGVFMQLMALPKGRGMLTRALRVLYAPPSLSETVPGVRPAVASTLHALLLMHHHRIMPSYQLYW